MPFTPILLLADTDTDIGLASDLDLPWSKSLHQLTDLKQLLPEILDVCHTPKTALSKEQLARAKQQDSAFSALCFWRNSDSEEDGNSYVTWLGLSLALASLGAFAAVKLRKP